MKFIKLISKGLIIGLLLNSGISSFAGVLSEDGRYETFEGNNITISDILEEDKVNIEIEGNTLVNLNAKSNYKADSPNYKKWEIGEVLKPDTTYTIVTNLSSDYLVCVGYRSTGVYMQYKDSSVINTFTTPSTLIEDIRGEICSIWVRRESLIEIDDYELIDSEIMLLEGDWTNKEIPEYFEGIQSSFENQLVTQEMIDNGEEKQENLGKYKVEIKVANKNLFRDINLTYDKLLVTADTEGQNAIWAYSDFIKVKPNTTYTFSNVSPWYSYQYDNNKKPIEHDRLSNTFTTTNECGYIRVSLLKDNIGLAQVEEGSIATEYEPYKESTTILYLTEPLRSLPNGIKDRIIKRNGQWVVERNLHQMILNESFNWYIRREQENTISIEAYVSDIIPITDVIPLNTVIDSKRYSDLYYSDIEGIGVKKWQEKCLIIINIKRSRLDTEDIIGFRNWIRENTIDIIYQLETPTYEPLNIDPTLNLYLDTTHISNNSNIPANMKVTIDRTINRATEAIELAKSNPTVDNLSKARMWINLLKESINKDNLHNQVNNITNIEDLEIDKKKATANVDVYIKSQNGLSMTLSTNSIIFDEFGGTEDMEKLNAVGITVDSSLPYRLNSYLMSEIKNEGGTNIIPKELFNIKINGENDYKAFSRLNEKLVLKEDCSKGENRYGIDLILKGSLTHEADVYKTTIKFEAEQK